MNIFKSVDSIRSSCLACRQNGRTIALVPTMGYLHSGHLSLIEMARKVADIVIVSIYVNPAQFGPGEDLSRYPRDPERDIELCRNSAVDMVFMPDDAEIYLSGHSVFVNEDVMSKVLCGRTRPVHFKGVLTIVAKLFNIIQPDFAVFGQKDAQQARLIQKMVADLNIPVSIILAPIVRDVDGLALSSRNVYLSAEERERALAIHRALFSALALYRSGERDTGKLKNHVLNIIEHSQPNLIDYIEILDNERFVDVKTITSTALLAVAVKYGKTRLIDNIRLSPAEGME